MRGFTQQSLLAPPCVPPPPALGASLLLLSYSTEAQPASCPLHRRLPHPPLACCVLPPLHKSLPQLPCAPQRQDWLYREGNNNSPLTNQPLPHKMLMPCDAMRHCVEEVRRVQARLQAQAAPARVAWAVGLPPPRPPRAWAAPCVPGLRRRARSVHCLPCSVVTWSCSVRGLRAASALPTTCGLAASSLQVVHFVESMRRQFL